MAERARHRVSGDGATAYVTHYLTEEPSLDAHVSVVDLAAANRSRRCSTSPPDKTTCETQNSGQGVFNLMSPSRSCRTAHPPRWRTSCGSAATQENNDLEGTLQARVVVRGRGGRPSMFPWVEYKPFPDAGNIRNVYKSSFHDITRFGIYKVDLGERERVGKIDVDEANNASDIEFSPDGTVAYVVDLMFNSYHVFNTRAGRAATDDAVRGRRRRTARAAPIPRRAASPRRCAR